MLVKYRVDNRTTDSRVILLDYQEMNIVLIINV